LCDVQEKFRPLIHVFPSVVHVSQTMIAAARILDIPLIVTEQYPRALGKTVSELQLDPSKDKIFSKTQFSMVIPAVSQEISAIEVVVLFGIEAHVCVLQTAIDLIGEGKEVHVLVDGTSSTRQWERMIAFNRMRQAGVKLTTTESLLFQLLGDSLHPKFKEISKLIVEHGKMRIDPDIPNSHL